MYVTRWTGGVVSTFALSHGIDRIEAMGPDAVVVGPGENGHVHLSAIDLNGGRPRLAQRYVHRTAGQAWLSHRFFYRADGPDSGVLGLPIRGQGYPVYPNRLDGSAAMVFVRNQGGRFEELGELQARSAVAIPSPSAICDARCRGLFGYDHSRSLFLRGRIVALLGSELVEVTLSSGRLREVGRVDCASASER